MIFFFFKVEFCVGIWEFFFLKDCFVDWDNMDWDVLGKFFEFSGGHIKNAVLCAVYCAVCMDGMVMMEIVQFVVE